MTQGQVTGISQRYRVRQALEEFLALPLLLILGFAGLGVVLQYLDRVTPGWLQPLRNYVQQQAFTTSENTGRFLDAVMGGMFTQVSIVITMLLVVLQQVDVDALTRCLRECGNDVEVILTALVGDYVSYLDDMADIKGNDPEEAEAIARCIAGAYRLERERDIRYDPTYGLEQLEMIAWTESSSAEHNPETGLIILHILHDLLLRWLESEIDASRAALTNDGEQLPAVYTPEAIVDQMMDILESLATVSAESMQHQPFTEVINVIAAVYPHLGADQRARIDEALRRIISTMGIHVLTRDLDIALSALSETLEAEGSDRIAASLAEAHKRMAASVGELHSRFTRTQVVARVG